SAHRRGHDAPVRPVSRAPRGAGRRGDDGAGHRAEGAASPAHGRTCAPGGSRPAHRVPQGVRSTVGSTSPAGSPAVSLVAPRTTTAPVGSGCGSPGRGRWTVPSGWWATVPFVEPRSVTTTCPGPTRTVRWVLETCSSVTATTASTCSPGRGTGSRPRRVVPGPSSRPSPSRTRGAGPAGAPTGAPGPAGVGTAGAPSDSGTAGAPPDSGTAGAPPDSGTAGAPPDSGTAGAPPGSGTAGVSPAPAGPAHRGTCAWAPGGGSDPATT